LPAASNTNADTRKDFVDISVDKTGGIFLDKKPVGGNELLSNLSAARLANPNLRVFISGDQNARHGQIIRVLDLARSAGIDKVAFEIRPLDQGARP